MFIPTSLAGVLFAASTASAVVAAGTDAAHIAHTLDRFNAAAAFPLPEVSPSDLAALADGDVVSTVHRRADGRYAVVGMARTGLPKEQVWVAALDRHFHTPDGVEVALHQGPHESTWYQWADIPAPFADRHWVVRVWDNVTLAEHTDDTMWEHPWALEPGAVHRVHAEVQAGRHAPLTPDHFEGSIETPVNEGAKDFLDLGAHDSLYVYAVVTDTGGGIPDRLVAAFLQAKMSGDVATLLDRARTVVPTHYTPSHAPILGAGGAPVPYFN